MTDFHFLDTSGDLLALHFARETAYERAKKNKATIIDTDIAVHRVTGQNGNRIVERIIYLTDANEDLPAAVRELLNLSKTKR